VIFKKCDMSNHRPETVKQCVSGTCKHTCPAGAVEKCKHARTLRYWVNGKQLEKSFKDEIRNGRVSYGSGRRLAQDFQLKLTVDKRSGDITFASHGRTGRQNFAEAAEAFISRLLIGDNSKYHYRSVSMKHLSNTSSQQARYVIVGTVDEAVKAGKLSRHRLDGIELADTGRYSRKSFVFPTYEQVEFVADGGMNPDTVFRPRWHERGTDASLNLTLITIIGISPPSARGPAGLFYRGVRIAH
jgi:hypothetical protein